VVVDEHGVELLVGAEDGQPGLRLCAIKLQQAGRDLERTHSIAANGSAVASDCCCRWLKPGLTVPFSGACGSWPWHSPSSRRASLWPRSWGTCAGA
jgi:hypothetical protein